MNKKTIFGIALMVSVALCACAQQYEPESNFTVAPVDGGKSVSITGYTGSNWTIRIPPRIRGLSVTHIGEGAFAEKNLTSIIIPSSVTSDFGIWRSYCNARINYGQ
jgi:hypothetical protein